MGFETKQRLVRAIARTTFICLCLTSVLHAQLTPDTRTGVFDTGDFAANDHLRVSSRLLSMEQNHKPMFRDCATYNPSVLEAQPRNTPVITIFAEDIDPRDKKGGKVTYSIVQRPGERMYFTINNQTGEIFTNTEFDRDEPLRQKELYLTVQASDNGWPSLADICTFKVTVKDINDNSPNFDQTEYRGQVSEDSKKNSEVMRVFAYDFDEGDNAKLTYSFAKDDRIFNRYFRIDSNTGVVYLNEPLKGEQGKQFRTVVSVRDNGDEPKSTEADIYITVVGSDKRPPTILSTKPGTKIEIKENAIDFDTPFFTIQAESNIEDKGIAFELVKGKTIQTNKDQTFVLSPISNNSAVITLARQLDYETVTEYQLTVRVQNKDSLASSVNLNVEVLDVNDEIPTFIELLKGSVVENDQEGAQAMTVRAIDKDGTSPNNLVRYELITNKDLFDINPETGLITTRQVFDREVEKTYHVTVRAYDGAPSAILKDKTKPNSANQTFQISIEDQNDNPPKFEKSIYVIENISESSDRLKDVVEVKAKDGDDASVLTYSIIEGNVDDAFMIEGATGRIKVNAKLDYETLESYNLTVKVSDGVYEDTTKVIIYIQNENDEPPVFENYNKNVTIREEEITDDCIIHLKAYDPDIKDRSADQKIIYRVAEQHKSFLDVTNDGCVKVIKKLDRDPPNGAPQYQGFIYAYDNGGGTNSLSYPAELNIILEDINDNAPILEITEIVWYENEAPNDIVKLTAMDYDGPENGPPFSFEISPDASIEIQDKFELIGDVLRAKVEFDREEQKFYDVPISITDSGVPPKTGVSILRVIIGDKNDNAAQDGSSEIFVYKYQGLNMDIDIGRVFVNDLDDWDLADKVFQSDDGFLDDNFSLKEDGMIVMKKIAAPGSYKLNFKVTEESLPLIEKHTVKADVTVTIKQIPEEAVRKSGSIRIEGTTIEEFVEKNPVTMLSKKDLLQRHLSKALNTSLENVDVFTVLTSPSNSTFVDVRFSAHGSPYYAPEKLNNKATQEQDDLERELGVKFVMVSINECLRDDTCPPQISCSNHLSIKEEPAVVFTNKTSFVGVKAVAEAVCECSVRVVNECFNGGSPIEDGCSCPEGFEGPHCEILGIGFDGDGWALYPSFDACNDTQIVFNVLPQTKDGLVFYVGPSSRKHAEFTKSFMALELRDGFVVLKFDLGYGSDEIVSDYKRINDGAMHRIKIEITVQDILITVDECPSDCLKWKSFQTKGLFKVNGPLQIGGRTKTFSAEESKIVWPNPPTSKGFVGCITNFTYNGYMYNLGAPSDSFKAHVSCNYGVMQAVTFGIDSNFLVAILVCIAILLILLLAVVVHKRKQDNLNEKDMDDTCENIINYEDEGGGECDASDYDLRLFPTGPTEKPLARDNIYRQGTDVPADISTFLDTKKRACDKDNLPYDDVRHYGYEGDGNTSGSLSSLASCTDEGDLKFNYLSSFGPRFRKLADMYGDDASEEGSQNGGEESWC